MSILVNGKTVSLVNQKLDKNKQENKEENKSEQVKKDPEEFFKMLDINNRVEGKKESEHCFDQIKSPSIHEVRHLKSE